jgi:hypothetical protein
MNQEVKDQVVLSVMAKYAERSATGIRKYGVTLDREDLTIFDWINHAQEEAMDFTLYLERIRKEISLEKVKSFSEGYREAMKQNKKDAIIELSNMEKSCACYGSNEMHECQCKQG